MLAKSVQARGVEDVLAMYEARQIPAFGIWHGNQFLHAFVPENMEEGVTALDEYLSILLKAKSAGIYTMVVYDDPPAKITNKTEYSGSINFRLCDEITRISGLDGMTGQPHYWGQLQTDMTGLRKSVEELQARLDEKEDEEQDGKPAGIAGMLLNPDFISQLPVIVGVVKEVIKEFRPEPAIPPSVQLSGINVPQEMTDEKKMAWSLEVLGNNAEDLPELLFKLAMMSLKQPFQFKMYTNIFKRMKV